MALELNVSEGDGRATVSVKGEVDLSSAPQLRDAILKAAKTVKSELAVELSGVVYMDSSGVATLVEGLKASRDPGRTFVLLSPSQQVMKVLQLSRLDAVFTIRSGE